MNSIYIHKSVQLTPDLGFRAHSSFYSSSSSSTGSYRRENEALTLVSERDVGKEQPLKGKINSKRIFLRLLRYAMYVVGVQSIFKLVEYLLKRCRVLSPF